MKDIAGYMDLWERLDTSVDANLKFAQLVINQEPVNTAYFFGDYSLPILKWVIVTLYSLGNKKMRDVLYEFTGDYYDFVSAPYENNEPQWYQLKTYGGRNGMKLKTWLKSNGYQYFAKKKAKSDKITSSESEIIEFVDYEALLGMEGSDEGSSDKDLIYRERVRRAWDTLSERDKNVLHYLVIEKLHWADAYDELNCYINPRGGREVMESWSDKRKQDALALMKAQSIKHLIKRFNDLKAK